jgi:aryl-alcohol dehydrogenase-like predicted oxidoreductase
MGAAAVDASPRDAIDGVFAAGAGAAAAPSAAGGDRLGAPAAATALAWVLRHGDVIAIPQSSNPEHLRIDRRAAELQLSAATLAALDDAFPPPAGKTALAVV